MNIPVMIQSLFDTTATGAIAKAGQTDLQKANGAGGFAVLMAKAQTTGAKGAMRMSQSSSVALKGQALIAHLKRNLQSSGIPLDQLTADENALTAIEKVLEKAGFDAGQVKKLFGELKANAGENGVKVSALFEGISRLTDRSITKQQPAYLEISSLPFIETLLAKFSLTPEQIKTALNNAKVEGKGIDAEKLASGLKLLREGAGNKKNAVEDDKDLDQIASMMQQIGLTVYINRAAPFDLEDFTASLQQFAGHKPSQRQTGATMMTGASQHNRTNFDHLKEMLGSSLSAPDDSSFRERLAAKLEMAVKLPDGTTEDQGQTDNWDLFVRNIHRVSSRNGMSSGQAASPLFASNDTSKAALLAGMDLTTPQPGNLPPLFSDQALFKPLFRTAGLVEKSSGHKSLPGPKTGRASGWNPDAAKSSRADAFMADMSAVKDTEAAALAAGAKNGEQAVDSLVRTVKADRNSSDISLPFLSDGVTHRTGTSDSIGHSPSQQQTGRMFPHYLLDQVSRQILRSQLSNESEIQIQLKPSSLGRLKMSIENSAEGLKVSIIAENHSARDMLLSHSGDLKTALLEQGIRLDRINVEFQADFNQTMTNTGHGSGGSGGHKPFSEGNRIRVEAATGEMEISKAPQYEVSGLNLVA